MNYVPADLDFNYIANTPPPQLAPQRNGYVPQPVHQQIEQTPFMRQRAQRRLPNIPQLVPINEGQAMDGQNGHHFYQQMAQPIEQHGNHLVGHQWPLAAQQAPPGFQEQRNYIPAPENERNNVRGHVNVPFVQGAHHPNGHHWTPAELVQYFAAEEKTTAENFMHQVHFLHDAFERNVAENGSTQNPPMTVQKTGQNNNGLGEDSHHESFADVLGVPSDRQPEQKTPVSLTEKEVLEISDRYTNLRKSYNINNGKTKAAERKGWAEAVERMADYCHNEDFKKKKPVQVPLKPVVGNNPCSEFYEAQRLKKRLPYLDFSKLYQHLTHDSLPFDPKDQETTSTVYVADDDGSQPSTSSQDDSPYYYYY